MSMPDELAQIEAFDEETASELQNRAHRIHRGPQQGTGRQAPGAGRRRRGAGSRRRHAGHGGGAGRSTSIKTLEDLAGCATDDLLGYYETSKDKERVRVPGALEGFNLTSDDANAIIMKARVKIGWIERAGGRRSAEDDGDGEEPVKPDEADVHIG